MTKRKIKFGDVEFDREARERINTILLSGRNTEGEYVEKFESKFAEAFGFKYAVMTSSGTTAGEVLWMAVRERLGVRWGGGSVITPALAFVATANCIMRAGVSPDFTDIGDDLNMARPAIHPSLLPIGIQFVLNMGRTVGVEAMRDTAEDRGLFFAIDACEGHGASYTRKHASTAGIVSEWADAAIYSFYPAHIMTVGGEGGMIATSNREIADLCRSIKSHGRPAGKIDHEFERIGTNAKTTEIAAAVGLSALRKFPEVFTRRRAIRNGLLERLAEFPDLTLYPDAVGEVTAPHAFPLLTSDLPRLKAHLSEWQIEYKPLWGALSNHGAHSWLKIPRGYFPVAEHVGAHGLHFGCHESMTDDDLDYIYDVFKLFYQKEQA